MDTDSFILFIKTDGNYKDIAEDVETRFDTSIIGLMKDELGRKIMIKLVELKAKTYNYLIDNSSEDIKAKGTKMCVIKRKLKFENYKTV